MHEGGEEFEGDYVLLHNDKKQLSKSRTQYMFFPTHQSSVASKNESNLSGSMSSMYLTFANTFSI